MAKSGVELHITAETGKAAQQMTALLAKLNDMDAAADKVGKKGKGAFELMGRGVVDMIAGVAGGMGALKLMESALDSLSQKARAVRDELARTAQSEKGIQGSFASLAINMPGTSASDLNRLQQNILTIAARSSLGKSGPDQLGAAASALGARGLGVDQITGILGSTRDLLQLAPGGNATELATSLAELQGRSNLVPGAANNLLLSRIGMVGGIGQRANLLKDIAPLQQMAGVQMTDLAGMASLVSQNLGDTQGGETANVVRQLVTRFMGTGKQQVEKAMGRQLSGNLFERFDQFAGMNFSDDMLSQIVGDIGGRGPSGRLAISGLLQSGGSAAIRAESGRLAGGLGGNRVADVLAYNRGNVPGFNEAYVVGQSTSMSENTRLARRGYAEVMGEGEVLRERMQLEGRGEGSIELAEKIYRANRLAGGSPEEALRIARSRAWLGNVPLLGGLTGKMVDFFGDWGEFGNETRGWAPTPAVGADQTSMFLQRIAHSNEQMAAESSRPQRPLADSPAND